MKGWLGRVREPLIPSTSALDTISNKLKQATETAVSAVHKIPETNLLPLGETISGAVHSETMRPIRPQSSETNRDAHPKITTLSIVYIWSGTVIVSRHHMPEG